MLTRLRTPIEILQDKWWIGVVSLVVSLGLTPVVRHVANWLKIVDRPDDLLKPHGRPVAYLGGIAMCIGLLAGVSSYVLSMSDLAEQWTSIVASLTTGDLTALFGNVLWRILAISASSIVITVVGLVDDLRDIRPKSKVLGQVLAAGILLLGGVGTYMASVFLSPLGLAPPVWVLVPLSMGMCFVMVIAICNATNLLDGLDGLCGGVVVIIALGFLALSIWLAMWAREPAADDLRVVLCLAMTGAVLGFLPYNAPPASIFMGDAGSMLLGFFVATLTALFCQEGNIRWFLGAMVVFSLPILDTALAVVRRVLSGKSIFAGDRSHLYDQLVDRGMTVKRVVILFYALAAGAAVLGVAASIYLRARHAAILYAFLLAGVWVVFYAMGAITPRRRPVSLRRTAEGGKALDILFTSAGRRVSLLREFRRAAGELGIKLRIHAADCEPTAPAMQVADRAVVVPPIHSPEYCPALVAYCRENHIDAAIPLLDPELRPLAEAKDLFADAGVHLVISSPQTVDVCVDKLRTAEFLTRHGFLTPRILAKDQLTPADYPVFIKPADGSSSVGARKITTPEDLAYHLGRPPECIVQEFIEGVEYTVDVFMDFDGRPRCAVPRRRLQVRAGEVSKGQAVLHLPMMRECCRLAEALTDCEGMITIQCFLTPDDRIVFIEINPRFGGGVPLSIRAGADSPRWILQLLLGQELAIDLQDWADGLLMLRYDEAVFVHPSDLPAPASASGGTEC